MSASQFTVRQNKSERNINEAILEGERTPISCWIHGTADVAETTYIPFQNEPDAMPILLMVRRAGQAHAQLPTGADRHLQLPCLHHRPRGRHPGSRTDHSRHAEIENAIRDLKYGVGLNHLPSGRLPTNGAWLAVQVIAHKLARWTTRIGLGEPVSTTKTLRRRFFSLAGRITHKARRHTLHLPQDWPCQNQFNSALARLRGLPLPS